MVLLSAEIAVVNKASPPCLSDKLSNMDERPTAAEAEEGAGATAADVGATADLTIMSPNKSAEALVPTALEASGVGSAEGFKKSPRRLSLGVLVVVVVVAVGGGGGATGAEPVTVKPPNSEADADVAAAGAGLSAGLGSSSSKSSKFGMGTGGGNAAAGDTGGGGGAPMVGGATTPINAMTRLAGSRICARLCWTKGAISPLHA